MNSPGTEHATLHIYVSHGSGLWTPHVGRHPESTDRANHRKGVEIEHRCDLPFFCTQSASHVPAIRG